MPDPAPREYWCSFGIGRTGFILSETAGFRDRKLGVEIYISHPAAKDAFDQLRADQDSLEAEFGASLDWQRMNDKKGCRIAVSRTDLDPNEDSQRPQQFAWFLDQMERFARVFRDRIRNLSLNAPGAETTPLDVEPVAC
jgi:hypothetical protein